MFFSSDAWVILDMEAGIEHLGRATAQGVDTMLVVVEPGQRSIQTAHDVAKLGSDIGVTNIGAVINKLSETQGAEIKHRLEPIPVLAQIPYDENVANADMKGICAYQGGENQVRIVENLINNLR